MRPLHPNTDEIPIKMVLDSYAIKNNALTGKTKKSGRKDVWPCKIAFNSNTSKDMAPDKKIPKPKCCFSRVFGMARRGAALRSRSVEEMLRKGM